MYRLKCWIISILLLFALLLQGQVAWAETDLLNLLAYSDAATPEYGENVLVAQDEKTGVKYLTIGKEEDYHGYLKFPVNLSGDFDVIVKVNNPYIEAFFLTADEYRIKVSFYNFSGVKLEDNNDSATEDESQAWKSGKTNTLKLSVVGNIAKLYINDLFSQKLILKSGLTYTQLLYQGLRQNSQLYQITLGGPISGQPIILGNQEPETDLLNLSAYSEATTPPYGENVLVNEDEKTKIKWLGVGKEANSTGRLKFPVNLSGDFDVVVKVKPQSEAFFLTADEYKIKVSFYNFGGIKLQAGDSNATSDESQAWKSSEANTIKLSVSGDIAKLYVNDQYKSELILLSNYSKFL